MRTTVLLTLFLISCLCSIAQPNFPTDPDVINKMSYEDLCQVITEDCVKSDCHYFILYCQRKVRLSKKHFGIRHAEYSNSVRELALYYFVNDQLDKSFELLEKVIVRYEKKPTHIHPNWSAVLEYLGYLHMKNGNYKTALHYGTEAVEKARMIARPDPFRLGASLTYLGYIYHKMDQYTKARSLAEEGILYLEEAQHQNRKKLMPCNIYEAEPQNMLLSAQKFLADLYRDLGSYDKAIALYQSVLIHHEKRLNKSLAHSNLLYNLSILYITIGQSEKALPLLQEAEHHIAVAAGKQSGWYGRIMSTFGEAYFKLGRYEEALFAFQIAFGNYSSDYHPNHPKSNLYRGKIAKTYAALKDIQQATNLYEKAIAISIQNKGDTGFVHAEYLYELGKIYQAQNRDKAAFDLLLQAKTIAEQSIGNKHLQLRLYLQALALNYEKRGQLDKSAAIFQEAMELTHYFIYHQLNHFNEKEQESLIYQIKEFIGQFQSFTFRHPEYEHLIGECYKAELTFKELLLGNKHNLLEALRQHEDIVIRTQFQEWHQLQLNLVRQYSLAATKHSSELILSLEKKADELEGNFARTALPFQELQSSYQWKNVQRKLKQNEVAIEFTHFRYQYQDAFTDSVIYVAYILKKEYENPKMVFLFEESELKNMHAFRRHYDYWQRKPRQNLHDLIWRPLHKFLKGSSNLYIAPSGVLYNINFAAIPINEMEIICDRYQLHNLGSTRYINRREDVLQPAIEEALIYGGINYSSRGTVAKTEKHPLTTDINKGTYQSPTVRVDRQPVAEGTWSFLAWTERESYEINTLLQNNKITSTLLKQDVATEESFKELGKAAAPQIIHLATHGFSFPDPALLPEQERNQLEHSPVFQFSKNDMIRSGLVMAGANQYWDTHRVIADQEDGILTALEIAQIDLSNTELVVLSACNSGLGVIKGTEGIYGLRRAFKIAGVHNLIMSLGPVNDRHTYEFMTTFYHKWMEGKTIRQAFYNTQKELRHQYQRPFNPAAWATFILVE